MPFTQLRALVLSLIEGTPGGSHARADASADVDIDIDIDDLIAALIASDDAAGDPDAIEREFDAQPTAYRSSTSRTSTLDDLIAALARS